MFQMVLGANPVLRRRSKGFMASFNHEYTSSIDSTVRHGSGPSARPTLPKLYKSLITCKMATVLKLEIGASVGSVCAARCSHGRESGCGRNARDIRFVGRASSPQIRRSPHAAYSQPEGPAHAGRERWKVYSWSWLH